MGKTENNRTIKLLALDVDGTLFDDNGKISQASIDAMNQAKEAGIEVVPTSGRDYDGIPWDQLKNVDINYVITTNGSAVYEAKTKKCLYEKYLDSGKMIPIFEYLLKRMFCVLHRILLVYYRNTYDSSYVLLLNI